jgi:hypothetical protein
LIQSFFSFDVVQNIGVFIGVSTLEKRWCLDGSLEILLVKGSCLQMFNIFRVHWIAALKSIEIDRAHLSFGLDIVGLDGFDRVQLSLQFFAKVLFLMGRL